MKAFVCFVFLMLFGISFNSYGQSPAENESFYIGTFKKYVRDHIRYPAVARENLTQGQVFISFKLNADKTITDIKILKGLADDCSDEVIRVTNGFSGKLDIKPGDYTFGVDFVMDDNIGREPGKPNVPLKNYLFDVQAVGYSTIKRRDIILDRTYTWPLFEGHFGNVKALIVNQYTTTANGVKSVLLYKNIEQFDNTGRLLKKEYYRILDNFYEASIYKYEGKSYQITRMAYRNKKLFNKVISQFDSTGKLTEEAYYKPDGNLNDKHNYKLQGNTKPDTEKSPYKYDDKHRIIEYDIYVSGQTKPYVWDTYKYDERGNKIEEITDIMEGRPQGNKSTFSYSDYDKHANWQKAIWWRGLESKYYVVEREFKY